MLKDELKQYAVYKSSGTPWTQLQYETISYLMGDKGIINIISSALKEKYLYLNPINDCFPFHSQNIDGKIPIEFKDFLALVEYKQLAFFKQDKSYWTFDELLDIEKKTGLKLNSPIYSRFPPSNEFVFYSEHKHEVYCWPNQHSKDLKTRIEFPYHLLDTLVQMKMPIIPVPNLCSEIAAPTSYKLLIPTAPFSIPTRQHGKTVAIDSLMKILGEKTMTNKDKIGASARLLSVVKHREYFRLTSMFLGSANPVREKFLTLKVKDGVANAKSLIYQTHSTGIKDPRQFIKDIISAEIKRVKIAFFTESYNLINYGFNVKLAAQVAYFTKLKTVLESEDRELTLFEVINFYEFEKENDSYSRSRERNEDICPFNWIKDHLTHDKINKPGKHRLFTSNKIRVFIKSGKIHYHTNDAEFNVDIKFNPESNQFSF